MIGDSEITTLAGLLADSTTLSAVIASNNAIDYLVRSTTFASDVTANQTAMSYIGLNNYASNTLDADSTWCDAMLSSTYRESVFNIKVPAMTSNNAPSGVCFGSGGFSGESRYYICFNGSENDGDGFRISNGGYVGYQFTKKVKIFGVKVNCKFYTGYNQIYAMKDVKLLASNIEDASMTTIAEFTNPVQDTPYFQFTANPQQTYDKYAVYVTNNYGGTYSAFLEIWFYGREDV